MRNRRSARRRLRNAASQPSVIKTDAEILGEGRRVIAAEAKAIGSMEAALDHRFCEAVRAVADCNGRIVTTAIGKSGFIARKLASTLASLGCPAFFVHPSEALHGDVGMVQPGDPVIAISHSGNSHDLVTLVAALRARHESKVIAILGNGGGTLASLADVVLETGVTVEACALGLAPTTSSTAALALGDALAVAASKMKGFEATHFATLHPAGALGERLRAPVDQIMRRDFPRVSADTPLRKLATIITRGGLGLVIVDDGRAQRTGIVTDGDIRRSAQEGDASLDRPAGAVMSSPPKAVPSDTLGAEALVQMERAKITALAVTDARGAIIGVLHIHDILRFGLGLP